MSQELIQAVLSSPFACGWRDKDGPVRMAWGNSAKADAAKLSLSFRDFHSGSSPSFLAPENFREIPEFSPPSLRAAPLSSPVESPSRSEWQKFCGQIEEGLARGNFKKIVPARSRRYVLEDGKKFRAELLPRLFSGATLGTFRFFLKWEEKWFFGATPEMLFRKENGTLFIPAIAGTRSVSDPALAAEVEQELLANAKERAEHQLVVDGIQETLRGLGIKSEAPKVPVPLRLRKMVHLYTPIQARGANVSSEALLEALHPTAAVGGYPQRPAQNFLRENEPLERGLFASPLLFQSQGLEVCLVGIRSASLVGDELTMFAGAGYVAGSHWEAEWNETGKKMDTLALLLEEERRI